MDTLEKAARILVLLIALAALYMLFNSISYYWIFMAITVVLLYSGTLFIIAYNENRKPAPAKPEEWPSLSVVIPSYNSSAFISKTLDAVKAIKYPKPLEIIVVDDASTDGSYDIAKKVQGIKVIRRERNGGKAGALNVGIKAANGEIVACIDSDTFPKPEVFMEMVPHFAEKKTAAVTTVIMVNEPTGILGYLQEIEYYVAFVFFQKSLSLLGSLMTTPGPLSIYRRQVLLDVGGFDEDNITEDMEIALRLKDNGYDIECCTTAAAYTEVPKTISHWLRQRTRWYRGKVVNGIKYAHIFFSPRHGGFGSVIYPLTFVAEFLTVVSFSLVVYLTFSNLSGIAAWLAVKELPTIAIPTSLMAVQSSWYFLALTLILWLYFIKMSFDIYASKIRWRHLPFIAAFLLFYSFLISSAYFISYAKEILGSKYKW
jgi:cellulose synthase/poly-beta-1,6-N-acetylglucosamine synthase-like glycosyltransferase